MLVVLEGLNGTGKSTQLRAVKEKLEKEGKTVKTFKFPDYASIPGKRIAKYLNGELGNRKELCPYMVSGLYAADRLLAREKILDAIATYDYVLLDRYVYSNIALQGAQFNVHSELMEFMDYIINLEFDVSNLPVPDVLVYLYAESTTLDNLLVMRKSVDSIAHDGKLDIHESDKEMNKLAGIAYDSIYHSGLFNTVKIDVTHNGHYLHERIITNEIIKTITKGNTND